MYHLAQLTVAKLRYCSMDAPEMAEFGSNVRQLHRLAENAAGFVWRYAEANADSVVAEIFGEDYLVDLTVWQDISQLRDYLYFSSHKYFLDRAKTWFQPLNRADSVLWWLPSYSLPSLYEAKEKLNYLHLHGSCREAFTMEHTFPIPLVHDLPTAKAAAR